MRSRWLMLLLGALALATVSFFVARELRSQQILRSAKVPFLIKIHERAVTLGTNTVTEVDSFYVRRRDGSVVEGSYTRLRNGKTTLTRTVRLVPERKKVLVHDLTSSVVSEAIPEFSLMAMKSAPFDPACKEHPDLLGTVRQLGSDLFLGLEVNKYLVESSNGSTEFWEAPVLDCNWVYQKTLRRDSEGRLLIAGEKKAVSVEVGDPDPALFAIPTSFQEKTPSTWLLKPQPPKAYLCARRQRRSWPIWTLPMLEIALRGDGGSRAPVG